MEGWDPWMLIWMPRMGFGVLIDSERLSATGVLLFLGGLRIFVRRKRSNESYRARASASARPK